jgi:hypothetical protein
LLLLQIPRIFERFCMEARIVSSRVAFNENIIMKTRTVNIKGWRRKQISEIIVSWYSSVRTSNFNYRYVIVLQVCCLANTSWLKYWFWKIWHHYYTPIKPETCPHRRMKISRHLLPIMEQEMIEFVGLQIVKLTIWSSTSIKPYI